MVLSVKKNTLLTLIRQTSFMLNVEEKKKDPKLNLLRYQLDKIQFYKMQL